MHCISKDYIVIYLYSVQNCYFVYKNTTKADCSSHNDMGQEVVVSAVIIHFLVGHMTVERKKSHAE